MTDTYKDEIEKLYYTACDPGNIIDLKDYTYPTILNLAKELSFHVEKTIEIIKKISDIYKAEFK